MKTSAALDENIHDKRDTSFIPILNSQKESKIVIHESGILIQEGRICGTYHCTSENKIFWFENWIPFSQD